MKAPTVILVEDEVQQKDALAMMLESLGYNVHSFTSAEEVLINLHKINPQMIVSDVKLTGMDGFSLFDRIRKDPSYKNVQFIFITAFTDPSAIEEVKKLGATAYLTKPYDLEELLTKVKSHLPIHSI